MNIRSANSSHELNAISRGQAASPTTASQYKVRYEPVERSMYPTAAEQVKASNEAFLKSQRTTVGSWLNAKA